MEITIDLEIGFDMYSVTLEGYPRLVNNGIGQYEYWGYIGNDVDMCVETDDYEIVQVTYNTEEEEVDHTVNDPELNEYLEEYINNYMDEEVQELFADNYDCD